LSEVGENAIHVDEEVHSGALCMGLRLPVSSVRTQWRDDSHAGG
jgi:hypothetical protein